MERLDSGWDLTHDQQRRVHALMWLHERSGGRPGVSITPGRDLGRSSYLGDPRPGDSYGPTIESLFRDSLVWYETVPGEVGDIAERLSLTDQGLTLTEQIARIRTDLVARRRAARDALLRWVYECTADRGTGCWPVNLTLSRYALFYGTPFSLAEINAATDWLINYRLLTTTPHVYGGQSLVTITSEGETVIDNGGSASDPPPPARTTITVTGSTGVDIAHDSSQVTQTATVTLEPQVKKTLTDIAALLQQAASAASTDPDAPQALTLAATLRGTANEPAPTHGTVQRVLHAALDIATKPVMQALSTQLVTLIKDGLKLIGLA
jgi:hypothetical protein